MCSVELMMNFSNTENNFKWVNIEKHLPVKQDNEVRFSRDKPRGGGAKQFAYATPVAIFNDIRHGYDNGAVRTYYEFRDPDNDAIYIWISTMNVIQKKNSTKRNTSNRSGLI